LSWSVGLCLIVSVLTITISVSLSGLGRLGLVLTVFVLYLESRDQDSSRYLTTDERNVRARGQTICGGCLSEDSSVALAHM